MQVHINELHNNVLDMEKEEQKPKEQTPLDENTKCMRNVHNGWMYIFWRQLPSRQGEPPPLMCRPWPLLSPRPP